MFIESLEEFQALKYKTLFTFKCKLCNKETTLKKSTSLKEQEVQSTLICPLCRRSKTCLERYGSKTPFHSKQVQDKIKQTLKEKYGVENISQLQEIKEKVKQTNLENYGVEHPLQNKEIKEKVRQTNIEKYGVENVLQLKTVQDKIKQTNLERYGVEYPSQNEGIKDKVKQTFLSNLGLSNPLKSDTVKCKVKQTNLEKYGVEYPSQNESVKEKVRQTNLERYGVEYPSQSNIIKEKKKQTWENKTPEEKLEIRRKSNKHNFYKSQEGEVFDSLWELRYYEYCKLQGYNIIREPCGLEYEYLGIKHTYYPDFSVNGQLVEVKGNHLKDSNGSWVNIYNKDQNGLYEAKYQCALENNVTILYQEDLEQLGIKTN